MKSEESMSMLLDSMETIRIVGHTCKITSAKKDLLKSVMDVAAYIDSARLYDIYSLTPVTMSILNCLMEHNGIPIRDRLRCVLTASLKSRTTCNWNSLLRYIRETPSLSSHLPTPLAVFMYVQNVPVGPNYRSTVHTAQERQWDIMQILNYLGRDTCLEASSLRRSRYQPNNFRHSGVAYEPWALQMLKSWLSPRVLLMAMFAISEDLFESSCQDPYNLKTAQVLGDIVSLLVSIPDEHTSMVFGTGKWKRKTSLRHMMYRSCMVLHRQPVFGDNHYRCHQELRVRRLLMIAKLVPLGPDYLQLWVKFWTDLIYNLSISDGSTLERELMQRCEKKMQKVFPSVTHWILFMVAASVIEFVPDKMLNAEIFINHLSSCGQVDSKMCYTYLDFVSNLRRFSSPTSYLAAHLATIEQHFKNKMMSTLN